MLRNAEHKCPYVSVLDVGLVFKSVESSLCRSKYPLL